MRRRLPCLPSAYYLYAAIWAGWLGLGLNWAIGLWLGRRPAQIMMEACLPSPSLPSFSSRLLDLPVASSPSLVGWGRSREEKQVGERENPPSSAPPSSSSQVR
jgi:hypothetical protein